MVSVKAKQRRSARAENSGDKSFLAVAEKLFATLETFTGFPEEDLSLDEVTKLNGLPKSTTYRLLTSLEKAGFLAQSKNSGRYSLGDRFFDLTNSLLPHRRIISLARPYLNSLSLTFGESVNLGVFDDGMVAHIFTIESPKAYRVAATVGNRAYLHSTSMGKAIAAHLPRETMDTVFLRFGLPQRTRNTLTSMSQLLKELDRIRESGVSHDNQEDVEGVECFGAPIIGPKGALIGSMSISGPAVRMSTQGAAMEMAVRDTARTISFVLGCGPGDARTK
jgi:DNA-binding IclR family transcriptional regulator